MAEQKNSVNIQKGLHCSAKAFKLWVGLSVFASVKVWNVCVCQWGPSLIMALTSSQFPSSICSSWPSSETLTSKACCECAIESESESEIETLPSCHEKKILYISTCYFSQWIAKENQYLSRTYFDGVKYSSV